LNGYLKRGLRRHDGISPLPPICNVGHHDSHAAAFFVSPFDEATVLVMDGYGDDCSTSAYVGRGNRLERQWSTSFLNSLGLVYTLVTQYLGFKAYQDEGKVMGLAAYGMPTYVERFRDVIHLTDDGRYQVNMGYFSFHRYGQIRPLRDKFLRVFGPCRKPGDELTQRHRDLAFALQTRTEEVVLHIARGLLRRFPSRNLCLSGGVALNCVANAKILDETDYERIWIPPNASDTGATMGSALWHYHQDLGHRRCFELRHALYGCEYSEEDITQALETSTLQYEHLEDEALFRRVARDLADGKIVGWFQGRFEMGPRALGSRSILADPRQASMKDVINARVKHREAFRPFAPAVLAERAAEFFHINQPDPFMTIAPRVRAEKAHLIAAVVHADQTGRFQTVDEASNPRYYRLIKEFAALTGVPVLLNTSFNRQEPIVARPQEAISCYLRTEIDVLVLGNFYTVDRKPAVAGLPRPDAAARRAA
jgi:carbamoyltransferase